LSAGNPNGLARSPSRSEVGAGRGQETGSLLCLERGGTSKRGRTVGSWTGERHSDGQPIPTPNAPADGPEQCVGPPREKDPRDSADPISGSDHRAHARGQHMLGDTTCPGLEEGAHGPVVGQWDLTWALQRYVWTPGRPGPQSWAGPGSLQRTESEPRPRTFKLKPVVPGGAADPSPDPPSPHSVGEMNGEQWDRGGAGVPG
jgi:hypothetical protein